MFGRKKAQAVKQAARAASVSERTAAAKAAKLRSLHLAKLAKHKKGAGMSPAERTKARSNSRAERRKSAPSV
jgi:hypothetical protein